ncbi:hypothetical protein Tco_1191075 [Tanacetum coccineum]
MRATKKSREPAGKADNIVVCVRRGVTSGIRATPEPFRMVGQTFIETRKSQRGVICFTQRGKSHIRLTRLVENLGGLVKRCNPESRQNKQGLELLSCQGAKDKAYEDLYKKLDSKEVANDIFRIAKARERRRDLGDISYVNDEGGRSITNEEDIKKRLGEYFSSLFNAIGSEDRDEKMGRNKAVGPDQILIEAWRCLGDEGETWLTCLFNKIFTSVKMPEEWRLSGVIPIYKNTDDAQVCSNYRGIKLLCHTMKL